MSSRGFPPPLFFCMMENNTEKRTGNLKKDTRFSEVKV
jgi:hypothetical protein